MTNIWIMSDPHIGHSNILNLVQSRTDILIQNNIEPTIENMNDFLIQQHNKVVKPDDYCINLGDIVMGDKMANIPKYLPQLHGHQVLILGNHDLRNMDKTYLDNGIEKVYNVKVITLNQILKDLNLNIELPCQINLSHFPYLKEPLPEYEIKHKSRFPIDDGNWLFYGHTHKPTRVIDKTIHLGVDAWDYFPVSLDALLEIIRLN